jgi:glycosyltransferase involved in cell wall biosynthesis
MPKALIIAYYFPPAGGSGVQRTLKFVKYLREFGWEPVILTARDPDYPSLDPSLEHELPKALHVYRSHILEPYRWYRKLTRRPEDEIGDVAQLTPFEGEKQKWTERLAETIRSTLFIPDARIGWLPAAVSLGQKIIATERIDLLYSSAPPYTTHLIGLWLKRLSRLPWVADFRDSWIGWLSAPQWRPRLSRALEMWMERQVLSRSDTVLTVSPGVREDLLSRHTPLRDDRWQVLTNGFDREDFVNLPVLPASAQVTLTYTGSLYGHRNPETLLQAMELIQKTHPDAMQRFRVRLVGRIGDPIKNRLQSSPVADQIEMIPYVTHAESLACLKSSDASLLIIDNAPANAGILTGKLFEYIGAGHPIVAFTPEGDAANLIRTHQLGVVISPRDVQTAARVLIDLIEGRLLKQTGIDTTPFERWHQTAQLARCFDTLIRT